MYNGRSAMSVFPYVYGPEKLLHSTITRLLSAKPEVGRGVDEETLA